jgi:hypothetical protein
MRGCYSDSWIMYSLARHSWPAASRQTTAAVFFHLGHQQHRLDCDTVMGIFKGLIDV